MNIKKYFILYPFIFIPCLLTCLSINANENESSERVDYLRAQKYLLNGDIGSFNKIYRKLNQSKYPLTPYLRYQHIKQNFSKYSVNQILNFSRSHNNYAFSNPIKDEYALYLIANSKWSDYLKVQNYKPKSLRFKCDYYYSQLKVGNQSLAWSGAKEIWSGYKQFPKNCKKLISAWKNTNKITDKDKLSRLLFLFKSNGSLNEITRLSDSIKDLKSKQLARQIVDLYKNPNLVTKFAKKNLVDNYNQKIVTEAYKRLVRTNINLAVKSLNSIKLSQNLPAYSFQYLKDYTAQKLMNYDNFSNNKWRDNVIRNSEDEALIATRIRMEMREAKWKSAEYWYNFLPTKSKKSLEWRFWHARFTEKLGNKKEGRRLLNQIVGKRDFYSAAAATILEKNISFPVPKLRFNKTVINKYKTELSIVGELIAINQIDYAIKEWNFLLNKTNRKEHETLSLYAHKHHWNYLTVLATIHGKFFDYIDTRFPLAHKWWFQFYSKKYGVDESILYALSRQESAFNTTAKSHAGARGLMQLMPATAYETAKEINLPYAGLSSLYIPQVNIELGTAYLSMMLDKYNGNRILAFASYNAGPHRVTKWLKESRGRLDVYDFIQCIPFKETRGYVKNILMYDIYYKTILNESNIRLLDNNELARIY
ncbi:lytic murein transglycosylase [Paraphotobacterium marinum]|uniref:Lytic murein transglycosylase n=1 Tax=Paraphotobacterium marinum TaxID=1755811 RepID=A0A220VDL9_9GAMM|nr:transglycosylase SLT domain-containing protein [Paraphotobacterium marinum]ASK78390.1 lytic murein transglycosylase [Paraphotobacterium marinum]